MKIFEASFLKNINKKYDTLFSLEEIKGEKTLQILSGLIILGFYITFFFLGRSSKLSSNAVINKAHTCWPYFQNCESLYFLTGTPLGYSQEIFMAFLFFLLLVGVYNIYFKKWSNVHKLIFVLFLWEFFIVNILSYEHIPNYYRYHLILTSIFLFLPHKLFFFKLSFVFMYFLTTSAKIHESWIAGTYFTALQLGFPFVPNILVPFFTNLVIFMEMIGAWVLLGAKNIWHKLVFAFYVVFHLCSIIFVGYMYPTHSMLYLLVLFGPLYKKTKIPTDKKSLVGYFFLIILLILQLIPLFIEGDEKLTLEGNYYGFYMLEANHQCFYEYKFKFSDGSYSEKIRAESILSKVRCDPYKYWFKLKNLCSQNTIDEISLSFSHSINGGPFYRIVDENNVCNLSYDAFRHNEWIKLPDEAQIDGYPVKNYFNY